MAKATLKCTHCEVPSKEKCAIFTGKGEQPCFKAALTKNNTGIAGMHMHENSKGDKNRSYHVLQYFDCAGQVLEAKHRARLAFAVLKSDLLCHRDANACIATGK